MKFRFLILALFVAMFVGINDVSAKGNAAPVGMFEVELDVAVISPTQKLNFDKNKVGTNIGVELRYNFRENPFDVGLHLDGNSFAREPKDSKDLFRFSSLNVMGVFDFNINRKGFISPFVGIGLGGAMIDNMQPMKIGDITDKDRIKGAAFCVMPRVGVEIMHRFRLTFYYKHIQSEKLNQNNSHFGLGLGIALGGGRR